jgi:hypothetical protein
MRIMNKLMRNILLYFSCLFLVFSCKAENKDNIKEKKNIISNDSIEIRKNQIQKGEIWYFYGVSYYPVLDLKETNRDKLKKDLRTYTIELKDNHIIIPNSCSNIEYVNLRKKSIIYFTNQDNLERYSNVLSNEGIKLSDSINIIRSALPEEECNYPFAEIMKIDNFLIVLYEGYLVFFSKEKLPNNFTDEYNKLAGIPLPIDFDLINSLEDIKFTSIPVKFKYFFDIDYLSNYKGIKLPKPNLNVEVVLISAYQEVGEKDLYLYTLSKKGEILDKLSLFSIEGETEQGENVGNIFNIDKNYKIKITTTLQNEKKIVKNYKINDLGKFVELKK